MDKLTKSFLDFIKSKDGIGNKFLLATAVKKKFDLVRDRSVYYCEDFAIRFSSSRSISFSNTIISLSCLQKYDDVPFIVCLVTPKKNILYLANTTFLSKISHSSQKLRVDNIRGSLNGSDIVKEFNGIINSPDNFQKLFNIHAEIGFEGNLARLVEATNNITPSGKKFKVSKNQRIIILSSVDRAIKFVGSKDYIKLKEELDEIVEKYKNEILVASFIENTNIRGRVIEYLIAGEDEGMRKALIGALQKNSRKIPSFKTSNSLGDYIKSFKDYDTATDVKTKIMVLSSNPKAYNIDKFLEFLSNNKSVFLFYFVGIEPNKIINCTLLSVFQRDLLGSTILLKHWAGRNSKGVTQFEGGVVHRLILSPSNKIDKNESIKFLNELIKL